MKQALQSDPPSPAALLPAEPCAAQSVPAPANSPECAPLKVLPGAVSASEAAKLPSTAEQYRAIEQEIDKNRPAVEGARQRSALLEAEAADLRRRLDESTAHLQDFENEKGRIDAELARIVPQERAMSAAFTRDRKQVAALLAVLERLQSDMPPVIALKADDALGAARSAMVLGASLPRIYAAAAFLSRELETLRAKRAELYRRLRDRARVGVQLDRARADLDQLLAIKSQEADEAEAQYGDLQARLDAAAGAAANLETLLAKVAALRMRPVGQGIVVVSAPGAPQPSTFPHMTFVDPVAGHTILDAGQAGAREPGVTILPRPGARVVSPVDGEVLFAGPYHKAGKVLILEMSGGYDLVLAGLDTVEVRPGDELLAGEPVGAMPRAGARLYFELRQNGKGVSPVPWMEVDLRKAQRS